MQDQINEILKYINDQFRDEREGQVRIFYTIEELVKYYRVTMTHWGQKSTYAFIAKDTFVNKKLGVVQKGDIFKAEGWGTPAKHARGNLFHKGTWKCLEKYGPCYLT